MTADTIMPPVHPGEILLAEFLEPLEISQYQLARSIAVPARRINEIVHGQRRISADTALRLARFFGTSERFWMNLQSRYDLEIEKDRLGPVLDNIQPLTAASLLISWRRYAGTSHAYPEEISVEIAAADAAEEAAEQAWLRERRLMAGSS
jgi:antitoxin HigA-1